MTWDEMVEVVAGSAFRDDWSETPESIKDLQRRRVAFILKKVIANGYAIVPREPTEAMIAAAEFNGPLDPMASAATRISAALSAGEIKPDAGGTKAMSDKLEPGWCKILLVQGVGGMCVYLNDYRIAGPKPWGGGLTIKEWRVRQKDIGSAIGPRLTPPGEG